MTEKQNKKLSRRDAIKLLGAAAGAAALANLPSKWSKPELVSGVLPAHAQTSMLCSAPSTTQVNVTFDNQTTNIVDVQWVDFNCRLIPYGQINPNGGQFNISTYVGHVWRFYVSGTNQLVMEVVITSGGTITIS